MLRAGEAGVSKHEAVLTGRTANPHCGPRSPTTKFS